MSVEEKQVVFAVSHEGQGDGIPFIILGITAAAWKYMSDGKTHNFDMTKAGIPVKIMLFGAPDHAAAMRMIEDGAKLGGIALLDERGKDFDIAPKPFK